MSGASISTNGIVVEMLNKENYSNWNVLMKNYLKGKGLWYGIIEDYKEAKKEGSTGQTADANKKGDGKEEKNEEWEKKNSKALHAIQLSCGKALGQIKTFEKASKAWHHLETSFSEEVKAHREIPQGRSPIAEEDEENQSRIRTLQIFVRKGFSDEAKLSIKRCPDDVFFRSPEDGRTVLHVAVRSGNKEIVKMLVDIGKERLLKMRDNNGYTALALAAKLPDTVNIAKLMVENKFVGRELLGFKSFEHGINEIPVLVASAKGHKDMTRYLYKQTHFSLLRQNDWEYGVMLLSRCISKQIFDVAASILQHHDARQIPLDHEKVEFRPIYQLAHIPTAFPSSATTKLTLNYCWKQFVYHILSPEDLNNNDTVEIVFQDPDEVRPKIMTRNLPGLCRIFGKFRQIIQTLIVKYFPAIKQIYDEKRDHYLVREILNCLCKRIPGMSEEELLKSSTYDAMLQAAKNGITELIKSMSDANPDLLLVTDESKRGIFAHAIVNRREEVFQLIKDVQGKEIISSFEDTLKNNWLHIAAELGPSSYLDRIYNAALQMQRELQWFQEVKDVMPESLHEAKDANGKTAEEVFSDEHKELLKSGQQWAKETATSFTLVGTLIITIMFAAAFTLPGGNDSSKGTPVLLPQNENIFTVFIISDAISLVTSSSSVLMFIGILTSRYSELDFVTSLPLKLLFGLVMLFLSVVSMMCAFCAAVALVLKRYRMIVIVAMLLAFLPILVFVPSLVSLASEIFQSTMRLDKFIAKKKKKLHIEG